MTAKCDEGNANPTRCDYQVDPDESVAMAVVSAVAAASGRDPTGTDGLDPLATAIDPGALDRIFDPSGERAENAVSVEFSYCDHDVTVTGGETVDVTVR